MSAIRFRPVAGAILACALLTGCSLVPDWLPFASWFEGGEDRVVSRVASVEFEGGRETASGAFIGQNGHISRGRVRVAYHEGRWKVRFHNDFILDHACNGQVYLGKRGVRSEALVGPLQADAGPQSYTIPGGLDVANYNQVWIICDGEPRARAELVLL